MHWIVFYCFTYVSFVCLQYFESVLISKSCNPELTLTEDRIAASAKFFGPSCKAGPWVPDSKQDRILKDRYPSLCQMCYDPYSCDDSDKHWGRRGTLYCLTNGGGSVSWARLDDTRSHFGVSYTSMRICHHVLTCIFSFSISWPA